MMINYNNATYLTVMLKWFVEEEVMREALKNPGRYLIEEHHVELRPEMLPDGVLDENVDIHLIRRFFSSDAWLAVTDVFELKRANPAYVCQTCFHDIAELPSVACDHCLSWWHTKCVGLKKQPRSKYWYCRTCHKNS